MRELGDASAEEHQKVVELLKATDIRNVWLVGEEFGKTQTDFRKFRDIDEVKKRDSSSSSRGPLYFDKR